MPEREVAGLGRAETPEETAERKAAQSRLHRANQTVRNLVWSLLATLIVVLLLVLVVVRPDPEPLPAVDYREVASQTVGPDGASLIVPELPDDWSANAASLRTIDQVPTWYIGFITPTGQFIAFEQGFGTNDTWLANHFADESTAPQPVDGLDWSEVLGTDDPGNSARVWSRDLPGDEAIVLYGTAGVSEFTFLATSLGLD